VVANLIGAIGFAHFLSLTPVERFSVYLEKKGRNKSSLIFLRFIVVCIAHYFQISIHGKLAKPVLSGGVAASISITAFPVIYLVLKE
jgi:hypothetical protein